MTDFQNKFEKLLEKVCDQCHEYATKKTDLDFYVFQTPLPQTPNPELLIIAINPGGENSYSKMLEIKSKEHNRPYYPAKILFFTTTTSTLEKIGVKNLHHLGNGVKTGILENRKIIAIPHPSSGLTRRYYSEEKSEEIKKILNNFLKP